MHECNQHANSLASGGTPLNFPNPRNAEYAVSWNRHDMAAFGRLFTENCDYVNIAGVHWKGVQEIVQRQAELF
jgi:hypothetical protein